MRISKVLLRFQDATEQIRVRGALFILGVFIVLAAHLGLEAILGAFVAGVLVSLIDRDCDEDAPAVPPQARGRSATGS